MKKSLLMLSAAIPLALAPTPGNSQSDANSNLLDRIFALGQPKASNQDREQVKQALDSAILNSGQVVDWSSSASGNRGTVVVTRSYTNSFGYNCRNYRRTTITDQTETVHEGTVCKQLFIGWTLESEKEVSSQALAQQPAPQQPAAAAPQTTQPVMPSVPQAAVIAPAPQQPAAAAPQTTQPVMPSVPPPVVIAPAPQPIPEVLVTQKLLAQLGYDPGPADGLYGNKTRSAIEDYQRSQNLAADGQVSSTLLLNLVAATERKADAPQTNSVTASVAVPPPPPLAPQASHGETQEKGNAQISEPKSPAQITVTRLSKITRRTAKSLIAGLDHGEITRRYKLIDNQFLGTFRQQGDSYRKAVANYSILLYGSDRDYKQLLQTKNWALLEGQFIKSLKHDRDLIKAKLISVRLAQIGVGDLTKYITFSGNFEDLCKVTSKVSVGGHTDTNCVLALGRWKFDTVTGIKGGGDRKSVAYKVSSVPNSISELIGLPRVTENRSAEFELHDDGWRLISR